MPQYQKELKISGKNYIDYCVGVYFLNLGPNTSLQNVLKPGYAIVEEI